ncbi:hypothetical protein DSM104635_01782 [Terricaulis silvestris]|uniref:Uncharacterized protein n=1 Tax=Terricaulis silvestris TaxID=2686094 RepID=A0A6I6MQ84_9CAUL|nr:hypothetical protein DSM104635_01782 [Terricaulis silvestris]
MEIAKLFDVFLAFVLVACSTEAREGLLAVLRLGVGPTHGLAFKPSSLKIDRLQCVPILSEISVMHFRGCTTWT